MFELTGIEAAGAGYESDGVARQQRGGGLPSMFGQRPARRLRSAPFFKLLAYGSHFGRQGFNQCHSVTSEKSILSQARYAGYETISRPFAEGIHNNPVNLIDPSGENPLITGLVGAIIGGGVNAYLAAADNGNWDDIGRAAATGAIAGGVTGLTLGFGGSAMAGLVGGGILGGVVSGAIGSAVGNTASQLFSIRMGWKKCFDKDELLFSAGIGGVFGGFELRPYTKSSQTVSSWASRGVKPDLNADRWVMVGNPTLRNYLATVGPVLRGYPLGNYASATLQACNVQCPGGPTGNLAGLLGQRIVTGGK